MGVVPVRQRKGALHLPNQNCNCILPLQIASGSPRRLVRATALMYCRCRHFRRVSTCRTLGASSSSPVRVTAQRRS